MGAGSRKEEIMSTLETTNAFDYINVLGKAADAAWLRNDALVHNIANVNTPGYKRQDVDFESVLKKALHSSKYISMDEKVDHIATSRLQVGVHIDSAGYSYRLDRNNVDIDTENAELASNQIRYNGLLDSISTEFKNLQSVMK